MKRFLLIIGLLLALSGVAGGWSGGGWKAQAAAPPANDEPGGGGCNPYPVQSCWAIPINGNIIWQCNTWWIWPC